MRPKVLFLKTILQSDSTTGQNLQITLFYQSSSSTFLGHQCLPLIDRNVSLNRFALSNQIQKMKKITTILAAVAFAAIAQTASAQFIIGLQGSYLTGNGSDRKGQFGVGVQGKGKISNRVALGGTVRTWLKNYSETGTGTNTVRSADATTQLAGMLEFYFGDRIQPYIGTDAGLYFTNTLVSVGSSAEVSNKKTYFGIGPKAGIQFNTGFISPFVQAQYHFLFGGGEDIQIPGVSGNPWTTQSSFATIDFGILFQIGRVGGKGNKKD
jgi:hypothetical protein